MSSFASLPSSEAVSWRSMDHCSGIAASSAGRERRYPAGALARWHSWPKLQCVSCAPSPTPSVSAISPSGRGQSLSTSSATDRSEHSALRAWTRAYRSSTERNRWSSGRVAHSFEARMSLLIGVSFRCMVAMAQSGLVRCRKHGTTRADPRFGLLVLGLTLVALHWRAVGPRGHSPMTRAGSALLAGRMPVGLAIAARRREDFAVLVLLRLGPEGREGGQRGQEKGRDDDDSVQHGVAPLLEGRQRFTDKEHGKG